MIPNELFRTQDGCVYETLGEAHNGSAEEAAYDLLALLLKEDRYAKDGDDLVEIATDIKKAAAKLVKSLDGKLITTYTL